MKENLIDKKFERLLVISEAENIKGRAAWLCKCDCGNYKIIKAEYLKNGDTKSCGCLNNEKRSQRYSKAYNARKIYNSPELATIATIWRNLYSDGDINLETFSSLIKQNCFYCNSPPSGKKKFSNKFKTTDGYLIYNGLDRIDNSKPHTLDNVITCCSWCNITKRERSQKEFKQWIVNAVNFILKNQENFEKLINFNLNDFKT